MGGQTPVQTVKHAPVDLRISDVDVVVVSLLDGFEVQHPDVALHNGPVEGVFDLLRPFVAVVSVAVLKIIPHGENAHRVQICGEGGGVHAGLHNIFPLSVGFNQANGDLIFPQVIEHKICALVEADNRLATGNNVVGHNTILLIAAHHSLSKLIAVVPVVTLGAGDDLHAGGLDQLHLLRHEAQRDIHELGGAEGDALHKALGLGVVVFAHVVVQRVGDGAVQKNVAFTGLPAAEVGAGGKAGFHCLHHKERGVRVLVRVGDFHHHVEAVIAPLFDSFHNELGIVVPPAGVLNDFVHHGGGNVQGGVLHQSSEVFLRQAHLGDAHISEFLQPPLHVVSALFGHPLQFVVVEDDVIGLIGGFHPPPGGDNKDTDDNGQGQNAQKDAVSLDILLHW